MRKRDIKHIYKLPSCGLGLIDDSSSEDGTREDNNKRNNIDN